MTVSNKSLGLWATYYTHINYKTIYTHVHTSAVTTLPNSPSRRRICACRLHGAALLHVQLARLDSATLSRQLLPAATARVESEAGL